MKFKTIISIANRLEQEQAYHKMQGEHYMKLFKNSFKPGEAENVGALNSDFQEFLQKQAENHFIQMHNLSATVERFMLIAEADYTKEAA